MTLLEGQYKSIAKNAESLCIRNGSRFMSFAFPVSSESEIKRHLNDLKSRYPDASHHCYVWILKQDKAGVRLNDDGEPSNTAARPILKQINALNITNILLVVVRYFGGKKLGIPGLIEAYGFAAFQCLERCDVIIKSVLDYYKIKIPLEQEHLIHNIARRYSAQIIEVAYHSNAEIILSINNYDSKAFLSNFKNFSNFECICLKTE